MLDPFQKIIKKIAMGLSRVYRGDQSRACRGNWPANSPLSMSKYFKRYYFLIYLSSFIIISSFLVGISLGLKRAKAREQNTLITNYAKDEVNFEKIKLPEDIELIPVGKNIEINGKSAELANFVTNRKVQEVIFRQMAIWKKDGLEVFGGASSKRGYAIALSKEKSERYAIRAFLIPESLRGEENNKAVQGMISFSKMQGSAEQGLVPGVSLMPGGKAGTLFSSDERLGRSYVGVYTNPGDIEDSISFYRDYFNNSSWIGEKIDLPFSTQGNIANLVYSKEHQEITLLFSALSTDKTVVNVIRTNR